MRIGIVPYANQLPLLRGLTEKYSTATWVKAPPSQLAEQLQARTLDVAAVSVFEGLRGGDSYVLIPGAGIGCDGPVLSVCLFSKVPLQEITSVHLDLASLTSSHLVRVLAAELLGISPDWSVSEAPISRDFDWKSSPSDAFLTIGDTALAWRDAFPHKMDLGKGWKDLTGLPFVFAAWFCRNDFPIDLPFCEAIVEARKRGETEVGELVDELDSEYADSHGGRDFLKHYLGSVIRYPLGSIELESIDLFRRKLTNHGILPLGSPMVRLPDCLAGDIAQRSGS